MKPVKRFSILVLMFIPLLIFIYFLQPFNRTLDFIHDETCASPCLGNIIPGETSENDALKIIQERRSFGFCVYKDLTNKGGIRYINCQSKNVNIDFTLNKGIITTIIIAPNNFIELRTIINKFGYPDGVSCGFINLPEYPNQVDPMLWFDGSLTSIYFPVQDSDNCDFSKIIGAESIIYSSKELYLERKRSAERLKDYMSWKGFIVYPGKDLP